LQNPKNDINIDVMNELKITKSNAIVKSSYRLSLNELRIVLYGLSHIDPTAQEFSLFHRINIKELADFYDIGEKDRGSFYDNIKKALLTKFWEREFSYYDEELQEIVRRRWLIEVRYGRKDGTLAYHYNPMIKNQLQQLADKFTSYFLSNVANMKSIYSIRLYEISIMYLNASKKQKTTFIKDIKNLKYNFDIGEKYKYFSDFKKRVLEPAKKEINKNSDIRFSYEVIRFGRTAKEIKFMVTKKNMDNQIISKSSRLSPSIFEAAKKIALKSGTGWDIYAIEQQFYDFIKKKGNPENLDSAFLGFVRKKVSKPP